MSQVDAQEEEGGEPAGCAGRPETPASDSRTGEHRVDDALGRLAELDSRPIAEHVGVFEDVHERLRSVLEDLDGS